MTVPRRKPAPRPDRSAGRPGARPAAAAASAPSAGGASSAPAARRPRSAPRPSGDGRRRPRGRRPGAPTGRAAVLALVLVGLLVTLALPLRTFVQQRQEIGDLQQQAAAEQAHLVALQDEQARLQDPAYLRQQARERLHYVLPGEVQYRVLDPGPEETATVPQDGDPADAAQDVAALRRPWYGRLWSSFTTGSTDEAPSSDASTAP